jgi:hypothetical protein
MTIQQFIEKAIEGGWRCEGVEGLDGQIAAGYKFSASDWGIPPIEVILLDPLAWHAVGKVEGWGSTHYTGCASMCDYCVHTTKKCNCEQCDCDAKDIWKYMFRGLFYALIEEKTIEEYLTTL